MDGYQQRTCHGHETIEAAKSGDKPWRNSVAVGEYQQRKEMEATIIEASW
jgi:hypothetical protein